MSFNIPSHVFYIITRVPYSKSYKFWNQSTDKKSMRAASMQIGINLPIILCRSALKDLTRSKSQPNQSPILDRHLCFITTRNNHFADYHSLFRTVLHFVKSLCLRVSIFLLYYLQKRLHVFFPVDEKNAECPPWIRQ